MRLAFWKMHGLGNDYVVLDNRNAAIADAQHFARRVCDRRRSVGADGVLLVERSDACDAKMRIMNADGSEAEMCGNGIRCFAKYCYENKIVSAKRMRIETLAGERIADGILQNGKVARVKVDMGVPKINFMRSMIDVEGTEFECSGVSVGNPHCVTFVKDVDGFPVTEVGPQIEINPLFPQKANVEFVQVLDRAELRMRVWERGVGETLACGTGACAAVVAANALGFVGSEVTVHLPGGELRIEYKRNRVTMTGPAEKSFEGVLEL
jgi:diaminopimelate epimerase